VKICALRALSNATRTAFAAVLALNFAPAHADFRQTSAEATVAFEGPSAKATKQYIYSRGTPVEVVVQIEGWLKVRDAQGALAWVEKKALTDRTNVQVKAPIADVLATPDAASPVLFRAETGVLLTLVMPQPANAGAWAQVRHRDGQAGFVRLEALFGL
jgi:SH3-like domain-containing protein